MDAALSSRWATLLTEPIRQEFPRLAMASRPDLAGPAAAGPTAWPVLWARCWARVRSWRVPPRWSARDWSDEARAQGALADSQARCEFDPRRGVPFDAFLYRRVVNAVRTRYRQEWSYGRRMRPGGEISNRPAPVRTGPDPEKLASVVSALDSLAKLDRSLIRQLFWDGRREDDLAREWGISQQAVSKRKQRILQELRRQVGML